MSSVFNCVWRGITEHHWICSHLRKTPPVKEGKARRMQDGGECTSASNLEDLHDQTCTGTNIWKRNYPLYGESECVKAMRTHKYSTTKTTHTLTWVKHSSYRSTTGCSSKLVCLCSHGSTHSLPPALLKYSASRAFGWTPHISSQKSVGKQILFFITDWELYFHENYVFLVHP